MLLSKKREHSTPCVPQAHFRFFRSLFPCCPSPGYLPVSSPAVGQCLPGSSPAQPSPLTLKTPGFNPGWLQELKKFSPCHFPRQWLWGNVLVHFPVCSPLSPFFATRAPSPPQLLQSISPPDHVSTLPTFFSVASSLS